MRKNTEQYPLDFNDTFKGDGLCKYKAAKMINEFDDVDQRRGMIFKYAKEYGWYGLYDTHVWCIDTQDSSLILDDYIALEASVVDQDKTNNFTTVNTWNKVVVEDSEKWIGKSLLEVMNILNMKHKPKNVDTVYVEGFTWPKGTYRNTPTDILYTSTSIWEYSNKLPQEAVNKYTEEYLEVESKNDTMTFDK